MRREREQKTRFTAQVTKSIMNVVKEIDEGKFYQLLNENNEVKTKKRMLITHYYIWAYHVFMLSSSNLLGFYCTPEQFRQKLRKVPRNNAKALKFRAKVALLNKERI